MINVHVNRRSGRRRRLHLVDQFADGEVRQYCDRADDAGRVYLGDPATLLDELARIASHRRPLDRYCPHCLPCYLRHHGLTFRWRRKGE